MPNVSAFFGKRYKDFVINNDTDFCKYLLDQSHVAVAPAVPLRPRKIFVWLMPRRWTILKTDSIASRSAALLS